MTWGVAALLDAAAARLREAGIEGPRREARLLLAECAGLSQEDIVAERGLPDDAQRTRFGAALARRLAREPLAYILGRKEFWSLNFTVGPGVLVPRPESETLIEQALKAFPDKHDALSVLDCGTGSGCLLLSVLYERPQAHGIGVDASVEALRFASANAMQLNLSSRAQFMQNDWNAIEGSFDLILANPPYIPEPEMVRLEPELGYEPRAALTPGDTDGLSAYRNLAPLLRKWLSPRGRAFVELGHGQAASVEKTFTEAGLSCLTTAKDLAGIARCLVLA